MIRRRISTVWASSAGLWRILPAFFFALACCISPTHAATPAEVEKAIASAKLYLYKAAQGPSKDNWEVVPAPVKSNDEQQRVTRWQWGGVTGCALYGLLAAGDKPQDPHVAPAINWLINQELHGHYAISMRCQMYPFLPDPNGRSAEKGISKAAAVKRDSRILMNAMYRAGPTTGFYSYYTDDKGVPQSPWADLSVSQISVLGVWACEQAGAEIPEDYWKTVDTAWKKAQAHDGGWPYMLNEEVRASMTAAGVATLNITQDYLSLNKDWSSCRGGTRNENIERGLDWVDKHIGSMLESSGEYGLYTMYGVERIGVASGRKYFGTTDWGSVGADYLIKHQNPDGSWGNDEEIHNPRKVPDTTFALLFLVRGRAPVIMNKLEYSVAAGGKKAGGAVAQPQPWDERPRDVSNFAHWVTSKTEHYFSWQIVNLKVSANDLHDSTVLYLAGSEALDFSEDELNKLRSYVEDGGLILGNSDCGNANFSKSFVSLGGKLFPKYEFRPLPSGHIIIEGENYRPEKKWRNIPRIDGLSNGVRELMLLLPEADAGKGWQVRAERTRQDLYELGFDICQYTGGTLHLTTRPESYLVAADPNVQPARTIKVVRLNLDENFNPEPGAWRQFDNVMRRDAKTAITYDDAKLGEGKLKGMKVAHLTGTTKFKLNPEQQSELKEFVASGGTLIVDACGGSSEFADSAETALAATFGGQAANLGVVLPPDHAIYALNGFKIDAIEYRPFCKGKLGHLSVPRVRGIDVGGRIAVLYSREDITAGLVGQQTDGILGYMPATARSIMRNMVLFAAFGDKGPLAEAKGAN